MCVWQETEAKRGSCEVASAVLEFLKTSCDLKKYDTIHTFSDSCGGQNRNKNVISMFMYVCETTNIQEWTHTFLESGHSYLPNDTDFGKIEKSKAKQTKIENFNGWVDLIKLHGFNVIEMGGKVKDINEIQKNLTFRNTNFDNDKFSWLKIRSLKVTKTNPGVMYYKCKHDPDAEFQSVDFSKTGSKPMSDISLRPLYTEPIKISYEKYIDMQSFRSLVPPSVAEEFQNLPHTVKKGSNIELLPDEDTGV